MIRLPIDTKSLYYNIMNDNETGHTATVATPIRQGAAVNNELKGIFSIPEDISQASRENMICSIIATSRAKVTIPKICVFKRIMVNGIEVDSGAAYCMYVREEIDENNVHYGRQKLHYPISLRYSDESIEVDNKKVIKAVSAHLSDYAFLVEAFEYDESQKTINFNVVIVGENGIPYSKVFLNKKGVGNKFSAFFGEYVDNYDSEIIALRKQLGYDAVGPENYVKIIEMNRIKAIEKALDFLSERQGAEVRQLALEYPYALYDIEVTISGKKHFYIVKFTSTKIEYFNLSASKIRFFQQFNELVSLILFTDINGDPKMKVFEFQDINLMSKQFNSVTFENRGE